MASNVTKAEYLIQLEDLKDTVSAKAEDSTEAGDLWLLNTDKLVSSYDSHSTTDVCYTFTRCSLEHSETSRKYVSSRDYKRCFSTVDEVQFHLLLAVKKFSTRLDLFRKKQELLRWAASLSAGCRVRVKVRNTESNCEVLAGIIRYAGPLQSDNGGRHFGIELDPVFEGKGTSNGEFKRHKYFECKEDCAVFVSVDKLEKLSPPASNQSDSIYFSDHTTSSSTEPLLTGRSVADIVQTCALAVNDRVVWMSDDGPEHGTVQWIGVLPDAAPPRDASQLTVGVEFDNPVGSGTGRYHSQTLFTAKRRHASLVPIMGLMKESDLGRFSSNWQLPSDVCADSDDHPLPDVVKQNTAAHLLQSECQHAVPVIQVNTVLSSADHKGCILPPSIADPDVICDINRGIQSYSDTCALEVIIFVLFAFYSYFDKQLFAKPIGNLVGAVKSILVERIVNPLRVAHFVSGDKMRQFGELFTTIQSSKLTGCATSSITLSDDPSGTIASVLCDLLEVDPLIALCNSGSYVYEVDITQTSYSFPRLQHVLECSVVKNPNKRLVEHPQSVFIVSVDSARFGKLVTCGRIFPGLSLDISGIMYFAVHSCKVCGQQGTCICGSCFTGESMREMTDAKRLSDYVFCEDCFDIYHRPVSRQNHSSLPVTTTADKSPQTLQELSLLELFAIVSFINGHYVSFLKVGAGDSSAWLVYDGIAAVGRSSVNNSQVFLPEIKRCQEIETWLKDIPASQRADTLPDVIVKLTSGLRLCFYRPRH